MGKTVRNGALTIFEHSDDETISLLFSGKSILDDPADFVLPALAQAASEADARDLRLVLDFRSISYMNSSTYAPLVRVLQQARLGQTKVSVVYNAEMRWQQASFGALTIFQTKDGRIEIVSADEGAP